MILTLKTFRWHRFGDVDMTQGGGFYCFDNWPYSVNIIRVTPCSDAGGPDNQFWVESGSIFMERGPHELRSARECIGLDDDAWNKLTRAQRRHALTEAALAYYGIESSSAKWTVQIGAKPDPNHSSSFTPLIPDYVLRANRSLEKYIYENREE